jgi:hypothetical protein
MSPQFIDEMILDLTKGMIRPKEKTVKRPCLRCRKSHEGTRGNRICAACNLANSNQGALAKIIALNGYAS